MAFTKEEHEMLDELQRRCISSMEQQDWTSRSLTEFDKNLIEMAVSWTFATVKGYADGNRKEGGADPGTRVGKTPPPLREASILEERKKDSEA